MAERFSRIFRGPESGCLRAESCIRDLYIGINRQTEGRDDSARRHPQSPALDAGSVRYDAPGSCPAEDAVQLRRFRLGILLAAYDRRLSGSSLAVRPSGPRLPDE